MATQYLGVANESLRTEVSARELNGMAYAATGSVFRQIESLFEGTSVAGLTDRQLLERFNARRDRAGEAAFAALVTRHGPMVLDICLCILGDLHHAEDAFQAVFLVLARRAGSIRDPDLLGNWLYGVALRTARCAKHQTRPPTQERGGGRHEASGSGSSATVEQPALAREDVEALHDEIARLPGSFRLPVILCYFEGLSLDEAARRLRWPSGTVHSRLARAREKLRRGLTRRGVALPAAVLATALTAKSASAPSHPPCATSQPRPRSSSRPDRPPQSSGVLAALAQEVLRAMLIHKLKLVTIDLARSRRLRHRRGVSDSLLAMKDEPKRSRPLRNRRWRPSQTTRPSARPQAGCSSSAACSTRRQAGGRCGRRRYRTGTQAVGCRQEGARNPGRRSARA